jgi:hypothetical protein
VESDGVEGIGKALLTAGLVIAAVGAALLVVGKVPFLGRLPGDVTVERPGFTFHLLLGTSLLLSAIVSLILWLLRR